MTLKRHYQYKMFHIDLIATIPAVLGAIAVMTGHVSIGIILLAAAGIIKYQGTRKKKDKKDEQQLQM